MQGRSLQCLITALTQVKATLMPMMAFLAWQLATWRVRRGISLASNNPICVSLFRGVGFVVCGVRQGLSKSACSALNDSHASCGRIVG